eukprot:TRINITY_DN1823_c0_g1_i2.p1 TRINITY_DN1823_c0_g1~~TRINITY_DN1823_c0_g1_i2.p1  ORF type:complete len:145 (-),score=7.98 TRINITY_DN1823_c0_g1_i2:496-930(-)
MVLPFLHFLASITLSEEVAKDFLKARNCLRSVPPICPECGTTTKIVNSGGGLRWRCHKHKSFSIAERNGSYWYQSKLTFVQIIWLIYLWANKTPLSQSVDNSGISEKGVINWFALFRDICSRKLTSVIVSQQLHISNIYPNTLS